MSQNEKHLTSERGLWASPPLDFCSVCSHTGFLRQCPRRICLCNMYTCISMFCINSIRRVRTPVSSCVKNDTISKYQEYIVLEIQIDKIDTLVNFDIDYANNIQKDDILYLKAEKKRTNKDSTQLQDINSSKHKNRFIKFWYHHISIGKTLSITPLNSSSNSFYARFIESKWQLDNSYLIPNKLVKLNLIYRASRDGFSAA